jgi:hypothetical protein
MDGNGTEAGEGQLVMDRSADPGDWSLSRIEIRTSMSGNRWPVARVELDHRTRGRVSDIATAPGAFEAVFKAASQIVGIGPELLSYNVCSSGRQHDNSLRIRIEIEIELDGKVYRGNSTGSDLVQCSLLAWLKAVAKGDRGTDGSTRVRARPFQVSGLDENDDLWIFASSDHGAAEAISREFGEEGYSDIQFVA